MPDRLQETTGASKNADGLLRATGIAAFLYTHTLLAHPYLIIELLAKKSTPLHNARHAPFINKIDFVRPAGNYPPPGAHNLGIRRAAIGEGRTCAFQLHMCGRNRHFCKV